MDFSKIELEILEWWRKNRIFEKSLAKPSSKGDFVFYEGPPTANGKPGIHHVISRAFKDIIPRFKTMRGYRVARKGGWDTHGLPVELEVEKTLGLKNKKEVEAYGIEAFNKKCRESVWKYKSEWEKFTERMGFWLDLEHAYVTYEGSYVNGLWGVMKKFWEHGLLYEGHKVVPHCPRCGTALSSHELALGYQSVKDLSLTIKFEILNPKSEINSKFQIPNDGKVFILSWTTTPWTLPGNVALAVGNDIMYVIARNKKQETRNNEYVIVAKDRLNILEGEYEPIAEVKGDDLAGLEYEPLFDIPSLKTDTSYKVYAADFVSTTEGTGVVHTAVMYGEDDYQLGTEVGLPKVHTVAEDGTFKRPEIPNLKSKIQNDSNIMEELEGRFVKDSETEKLIIGYLDEKNLILKKELYEHDYPFCWRCKTPLLYYAKHSWFVAMSKLRNELIEANSHIHWVPDYIKEGRFGEWLREVKDWAFSRERYWGTPLPIWRCQIGKSQIPNPKSQIISNDQIQNPETVGGCGRVEVIGSVAALVQKSKLKNRYIFMRHGEARSNVENTNNAIVSNSDKYPLTDRGREAVKASAQQVCSEHIDFLVASDFVRTRETAEIIARAAGIEIRYDERLREFQTGLKYEERPDQAFASLFSSTAERFTRREEGGELLGEALIRMQAVVRDCEEQYEGKIIVIVSHGDPLWVLTWALAGSPGTLDDFPYPQFAQPIMVDHGVFLTDEHGELDLHRPRVDEVEFPCTCGGTMRRVAEVADVWFDSGAMPFAQYPENIQALINADTIHNTSASIRVDNQRKSALWQFPADFISEAIDQTRGWFYTLLAVAVALQKGAPYKNVICLGHVLDAKGKKMSKSLGNIIVPEEVFAKYGADAVRWYLYTMNDPGLPKRFNEKELGEVVKKFFMILWNVVSFHALYPPQQASGLQLTASPSNVLDRWILARLNQLTKFVTERLDAYDITPAGRAIEEFVTDLSTWYVRRSRERMKAGDEEGRATLKYVLAELSKLIAPFAPFTAEALWQKLTASGLRHKASVESVHLAEWSEAGEIDAEVVSLMDMVRKIVEAGLAARAEAKMPIRQPLQSARVAIQRTMSNEQYIELVKDELNVKEIVVGKTEGSMSVELDTNLTEELKLEGMKREFVRAVNNLRKQSKLTIKDRVRLEIVDCIEVQKLMREYKNELFHAILAKEITSVKTVTTTSRSIVELGGAKVEFGIDVIQ
ncbi:MAG: class I tRNA ligase family protein [Patescibacteria group bacterium]